MYAATASHRVSFLIFSILFIASTQAAAQAGQLDPTFGQGGIVTTDFANQTGQSNIAAANAVTIQPDGKILVCGGAPTTTGFPTAAVARYNTDGSLDTGFGTAGIAVTPKVASLAAIALQTDGKIVAIGSGPSTTIDVVRYSPNGSLDPTFGKGGIAEFVALIEVTGGVVVQPDGKIVVADRTMFRLLPEGQVDSSFGTGTGRLAGFNPTALALLPSGKILVSSALAFATSGFQNSGFVSRYNSDGTLDTGFGINGQLATAGPADAMVLLGTGEFLIGGGLISNLAQLSDAFQPSTGFAVSRYFGMGATDAKFATHGGVLTALAGFPTIVTSGLGVQSSGDIVVLGTAIASSIVPHVFALVRYTPTGQLDTTFGTNGTVTTSFGNIFVNATALAIQSDGKIVAVGSFTTTENHGLFDTGFKLTRYLGQ
jgi:uncharacterized delta-60 repeat protein